MSTWHNPGGETPPSQPGPGSPDRGGSPPGAAPGPPPPVEGPPQQWWPGPGSTEPGPGYHPQQYGQGYPGQYGYPQPPGYFPPPSAKPGVMALRPQNVGDLLDVAFSTIKANPLASLGTAFLGGLVSVALMALVMGITALVSGSDSEAVVSVAPLIGGPLSALCGIVFTLGLVHVFSQAVLGHRASIGESLKAGVRRLLPALGFALLLGLAAVVVIFALAMIIVGLVDAHVNVVLIVLLVLVVMFALLLCSVRFAFGLHVTVMESAGPLTSISRSVRLTRKRMWRTFGVLLLAGLITGIISSVVQTVARLLATLIFGSSGTLTSEHSGTSTGPLIGAFLLVGVVSLIASVFTQPFLLNVIGALYLDARFRDEGLASSLLAHVAAGQGVSPAPAPGSSGVPGTGHGQAGPLDGSQPGPPTPR